MSYPRIYSLSTVGILKHYVHDYLFHPKRTDFVGSNGVGKSIIADLLQMLFVYDKDLIKFGTDGVKKEERQINTLAYKTKCAFCFLNIEVDSAKFITVGIQINSQKGKRIIPFVITKQPDLNLKIDELSIDKEELLFSKNILKEKESGEKEILDVQDLAKFLFESKKLYLNYFKNIDEIQTYYRFLYDKNILPLNLSLDKNLNAYAKVIQSFSKAKTLNLSGNQASKNLQEFLFEESDEDIIANFQKEQHELEKILKEYQSLNNDIQTLTEKQKKLTSLRDLEQTYATKHKGFKEAQLCNAYIELQECRQNETKGKSILGGKTEQLKKLQSIIEKIPRVEKAIKQKFEQADENNSLYNDFEKLSSTIESLSENFTDLKMLILPAVDESWKYEVERIDTTIRTIEDIKKEISFAEPYLKKYRTYQKIVEARSQQSQALDELKASLKYNKGEKERLLSLLQNNDEDGLLHWYIHNLPETTSEQLQAIMHFATISTSKISNNEFPSKYINPKELLENFEATSSEGGIWLKLGALNEFIPINRDADLLGNNADLQQSVEKLIQKLTNEIKTIDTKQGAIINIIDGKSYNTSLFDYIFDISIIESSNLEKLKNAVACILQIDEKVAQINSQKIKKEEELCAIKARFKIKYDEPEVVKKELQKMRKIWLDRITEFSKYIGAKTGELTSVQKELEQTRSQLLTVIENVTKQQKIFDGLNQFYFQEFNKTISDFGTEKQNIEELNSEYVQVLEEYKRTYIGIKHTFQETSNEKNSAVQLSIKDQTYSFRALEEALLGNKIKSTDDIASALQEANQTRTTIADGMRDNMIKIFGETSKRYDKYKEQIQRINTFFVDRKISEKFQFKLGFLDNKDVKIDYVKEIAYKVRETATKGELQFGQSIIDFIEDFFKKQARLKDKVPIEKLLNPKTYFDLSAKLTDQFGEEVSGSTGETYSAIALLGIARLSAVQKETRRGLRFIILEELGSLDNTNFNTFPAIAEEFQYQIITMAPHTFNIGLSDDWYAHYLIKGNEDDKINYHPSSSFFKTSDYNEDLNIYLNKVEE